MKYLRDAPIGTNCDLARATARGLDLRKIEAELAGEKDAPISTAVVREIVVEVLGSGCALGDLKNDLEEIKRRIGQQPKAIVYERPDERWVENRAGGVLHIVRNELVTFCGWPYAVARDAILREDPNDPSVRLCSSCVKYRGLHL